MTTLLATLLLAVRTCGGVSAPDDTATPDDTAAPDDSGVCTATYDPEGAVPITFKTWDPAEPCGTLAEVTEEHDAAYWGEWWRDLTCYDIVSDDVHYFTDATGRCIYFSYSVGWEGFEDPWLIRLEEGHACQQEPSCP
jgi:hypothetical protein